jgi:hypothetical protein
LAGCIAGEGQWAVLDYQWRELLTDFGITNFHAVEMENRRGQFKAWKDATEQSFRKRARAICKVNTICIVAAAVDNDAHKRFRGTIKTLAKRYSPDSAYGECFRQCMIMSCGLVSRKYTGEQVSFVLAGGDRNVNNAFRIFQRNKHRPQHSWCAPFLGSITVGSGWSSLQVADFIANETMKDVCAGRFKSSPDKGPRLRALCNESFFVNRLTPAILDTQTKMREHAVQKLKASGDAASLASSKSPS